MIIDNTIPIERSLSVNYLVLIKCVSLTTISLRQLLHNNLLVVYMCYIITRT